MSMLDEIDFCATVDNYGPPVHSELLYQLSPHGSASYSDKSLSDDAPRDDSWSKKPQLFRYNLSSEAASSRNDLWSKKSLVDSKASQADRVANIVVDDGTLEVDYVASPNRTANPRSTETSDRPITTVMLRNIPNKYTQHTLLDELCRHGFTCGQAIDFFYLPIDSHTNANFGYAFINFMSIQFHEAFRKMFEGRRLERYNSRKILCVVPASLQGLQANWNHYSMSTVMSHPEADRRPLFFNVDRQWSPAACASWAASSWKTAGMGKKGGHERQAMSARPARKSNTILRSSSDSTAKLLLPYCSDRVGSNSSSCAVESVHTPLSDRGGTSSSGFAKFCGNCGSKRIDVAKFCTQCGSRFQDGPTPPRTGLAGFPTSTSLCHSSHSSIQQDVTHPHDPNVETSSLWQEICMIMEREGIARDAIQDFLDLSTEAVKRKVFQLFQANVRENVEVNQSELLRSLVRSYC
eukprot:GEMP01024114.1.p1 GENE.GEMP01024114.1~~GEMP01024114.1.p1  ORF type:complete len:465 (+),score=62.65 GEMP01024114.1:233-1627(+)